MANKEKDILAILGAGQYGSIVKEIAETLGYEVKFFDDGYGVGHRLNDVDVNGVCAVAIGNSLLRKKWVEQINAVSLIHPTATVSASAQIGKGCIVEAGAIVASNAVIGNGTIVMSNAVVGHDAVVGEYCQLKYNCTIPERMIVPDATKVDCNVVFSSEVHVI